MPSRWPLLALLLAMLGGCQALGRGPAWEALVASGRLDGEVSAEDGRVLSFQGSLPGPGEIAEGPLLLLIHGWCGNASLWGELSRPPWAGRNVVSLDLPGHGASMEGPDELSTEAFAADVARLIDHLGLGNVILVGQGWGGQIALDVAHERPRAVRGVVAVECFHDLAQEFTVQQAALMEHAFRDDFAGTMALYLGSLVGAQGRGRWLPQLTRTMTAVPLDTALGTLRAAFQQDVRAALVTLPVPLVLLNGDQRPTNLGALRELLPFATVERVSGAGLFPQLEQPQGFGRALDRALRTIAALWQAPR